MALDSEPLTPTYPPPPQAPSSLQAPDVSPALPLLNYHGNLQDMLSPFLFWSLAQSKNWPVLEGGEPLSKSTPHSSP
jgi:hypothetical protein